MSIRCHKPILAAIIVVCPGLPPGKGKGKSSSIEFQLQKRRMDQFQKEILKDYIERLWTMCYPEEEDIVMGTSQ
jgi:hypothetical protein